MIDDATIPLNEAEEAAGRIVDLLAPACERIMVVGSIRRRQPFPSEVEIVCIPKMVKAVGVLIDDGEMESALEWKLWKLFRGDWGDDRCPLRLNTKAPANGDRYKRLVWHEMKVNLFIVSYPASWGALLAIRTGPADFSRLLATSRDKGGAMPAGLRQHDGSLHDDTFGRIDTPEEADFFRQIGVPCWPPEERTEKRLVDFLSTT